MASRELPVVCLWVGDALPEGYVERLDSMLRRHMTVPYRLHCVTDRPRPLPSNATSINAWDWPGPRDGMRPTTYKLNLYDPARMPFEEFLYLDTTLVIRRNLGPLLEFARTRSEPLTLVRDWGYDAYNTCAMWVRPGDALAGIVRAYEEGTRYVQKTPGDQDFVTAYVLDKGIEDQVACFPPEFVASYKVARTQARKGIVSAKETLDQALIVKFHGHPKMHELLDPRYRLVRLGLLKPLTWRVDMDFWADELREYWR